MYCPCPYHEKKESSVLFNSNDKSDEKLDVKCTSKTHNKPTLYKCGSCNLIFSEHIKRCIKRRIITCISIRLRFKNYLLKS